MAKTAAPTPKPAREGSGKASEALGSRMEVYYPGFGSYYEK